MTRISLNGIQTVFLNQIKAFGSDFNGQGPLVALGADKNIGAYRCDLQNEQLGTPQAAWIMPRNSLLIPDHRDVVLRRFSLSPAGDVEFDLPNRLFVKNESFQIIYNKTDDEQYLMGAIHMIQDHSKGDDILLKLGNLGMSDSELKESAIGRVYIHFRDEKPLSKMTGTRTKINTNIVLAIIEFTLLNRKSSVANIAKKLGFSTGYTRENIHRTKGRLHDVYGSDVDGIYKLIKNIRGGTYMLDPVILEELDIYLAE